MNPLTPAERRALRAKAHHLQPVVAIGQHGLTPPVLQEINLALTKHELIKVRVFSDERDQREAMLAQVCADMDCAAVQHLGKVLVVWRPNPELHKPAAARPVRAAAKPGAKRPKAARTGPRTPVDPVRERRRGAPLGRCPGWKRDARCGAIQRAGRRFRSAAARRQGRARTRGRDRAWRSRHIAPEDPRARRREGARRCFRCALRGPRGQAQIDLHAQDQAQVLRRQAQSTRVLGEKAAGRQRQVRRHASTPTQGLGGACVAGPLGQRLMETRRPLDALAVVLMLLLASLWGFQQVAIKLAAPGISLVMQGAIRSGIACVLVMAWARWRRIVLLQRDGTLAAGVVAGLLFAGEFALIYAGLAYTTAARMVVFIYLAPVLTALGLALVRPGRATARGAVGRHRAVLRGHRRRVRRGLFASTRRRFSATFSASRPRSAGPRRRS